MFINVEVKFMDGSYCKVKGTEIDYTEVSMTVKKNGRIIFAAPIANMKCCSVEYSDMVEDEVNIEFLM